MPFDFWPDIQTQCPVCGKAVCAVYRGYYKRFMYCTELEFFGLVVIRTGFCKREKKRFNLLPTFLIPYRRISYFSFQRFIQENSLGTKLIDVIDELTSGLGDEFYFPLSTAYSY